MADGRKRLTGVACGRPLGYGLDGKLGLVGV
jgi:hypothetical protein